MHVAEELPRARSSRLERPAKVTSLMRQKTWRWSAANLDLLWEWPTSQCANLLRWEKLRRPADCWQEPHPRPDSIHCRRDDASQFSDGNSWRKPLLEHSRRIRKRQRPLGGHQGSVSFDWATTITPFLCLALLHNPDFFFRNDSMKGHLTKRNSHHHKPQKSFGHHPQHTVGSSTPLARVEGGTSTL